MVVSRILILAALFTGLSAGAESHPFFTAGWNSGGPALFDASFEKTWQLESKDELSDGWVLPDGGIVYSFSKRKQKTAGVIRLDKNKKEIWTYTAPDNHDNHSCQPLPHGGFLLGECASDGLWMVEISKTGKELKRIKVADAAADKHHAFRMVRKTSKNTYLGTLMKSATYKGKTLKGGHAYEWDQFGKLIHTFPSGSFLAVRLPNGNTLVSDGHGRSGHHTVLTEYAPDDSVVWALSDQDLKTAGLSISMVCGFHRLPNGNTVASNVKHGKATLGLADGDSPKAFEITRAKKVVWKVPASTSSHHMGSIQLLDVRGNPFKLEVFR